MKGKFVSFKKTADAILKSINWETFDADGNSTNAKPHAVSVK